MTVINERSPPPVVKMREAARLIAGSRSEIYRLLHAGRLRGVKRGAALLITTDSIREHLESLPAASFGTDRAHAICQRRSSQRSLLPQAA